MPEWVEQDHILTQASRRVGSAVVRTDAWVTTPGSVANFLGWAWGTLGYDGFYPASE
jgi:hypothetical protein